METSTKERLTGALLVVLAVVVVAPELFSGRPPVRQGIQPAQNPEDGAPLQTINVQLDNAGAPVTPLDSPAAAAAELAAVPPPVTPDGPPVNAGPDQPNGVVDAPPPTDTAVRSSGDMPPPAVASKKPAVPAVAASGNWWVQVGSFGSEDNARHLAKKLQAAGYAMEVSRGRSNGKDLYRVRAGPVADRAAARALQERLVAAGEKNPTLVAP